MLSMVFIDEVHLMVQFGLHFRAEFLHWKALLFLPLVVAPPNHDLVDNNNS
jgi:superfamily II DNA helicase RecQ